VAWRMQTILNDLRWREGERARARQKESATTAERKKSEKVEGTWRRKKNQNSSPSLSL
jgi:hypothetical protein